MDKKNQKLHPFCKFAEAATRGVLKRMVLEISQNSQENTCDREDLWTTASEFVTEMLIFRSSRS